MEKKAMMMSVDEGMDNGSCEVEQGAWARRLIRVERSLSRGVTLVEVLIVVAIMAVIAGGATVLVFPQFKKARVKTAHMSAGEIKKAADLYQNLNATGDTCPTIQDLIASKTLDAKKVDDPWGTPFKLACVDAEVRVISFGNDKKENTPDDIRDDMKPSELEKIGSL
jgi:general secretion pathway protein G